MMLVERESYDFSSVTFSPDGRLYQVEYAREAVKSGTPAIGMIFKDGVMLIAKKKRIPSIVVEGQGARKIYQIAENIGAVTSGLVADARAIVEFARIVARRYQIIYGERVPPWEISKEIGDIMQLYTQFAGLRPFGIVLLIGGITPSSSNGLNSNLFEIDPSGAIIPYYATAIGRNKEDMLEVIEAEYKKDLNFKKALKLAITAINNGVEAEDKIPLQHIGDHISVATITMDGYKEYSGAELEKFKWK